MAALKGNGGGAGGSDNRVEENRGGNIVFGSPKLVTDYFLIAKQQQSGGMDRSTSGRHMLESMTTEKQRTERQQRD